MVRRKLMTSGTAALRSLLKTQRPAAAIHPALSLAAAQPNPPHQPHLTTPSLTYINERVNTVFNIILAEIHHKNTHPTSSQHSPNAIYKDPYNFKDHILQDLVANSDITTNYNIHDLIEEEFQLEISDQEFQQFKSLGDIVKYVRERLEIRNSMVPYGEGGQSNTNLTY